MVVACVEQAEDKPTAEDLEVVKQNLLASAPTPQFPVNADIDGKVVYLGLDASLNPIEPGKDVKLTHYWKVVAPPGAGWRMFTHLNGPNKTAYMNVDHGPIRGKYPVSQWKAGDIIKDEHNIRLPPTWSHERVEVFVGLWRGQERMAVRSGPKDAEGRILAAAIPVTGAAKPPEAKKYLATKVTKPIKLDGKLDEPAWKDAPWAGEFVETLTGNAAPQKSNVKMLWDKNNLYFGFELEDKDVWSKLDKRDDKLWTQEAVEIMIDANGDKKSYVEFQVAPNGAIFDTYLPEYRKYEDSLDPKRKMYDWNSKIKAAAKVDGTINKRDDEDKGWTVEIALPLADVNGLATDGVKVPPELGATWKLNMFRMDSPEGKGQSASGWSPPLVGDFHALDKFGALVFANEKGEVPAAAPPAEAAKEEPKGEPTGAKAEKSAALKRAMGEAQAPGTEAGGALQPEGAKKRAAKRTQPEEK